MSVCLPLGTPPLQGPQDCGPRRGRGGWGTGQAREPAALHDEAWGCRLSSATDGLSPPPGAEAMRKDEALTTNQRSGRVEPVILSHRGDRQERRQCLLEPRGPFPRARAFLHVSGRLPPVTAAPVRRAPRSAGHPAPQRFPAAVLLCGPVTCIPEAPLREEPGGGPVPRGRTKSEQVWVSAFARFIYFAFLIFQ